MVEVKHNTKMELSCMWITTNQETPGKLQSLKR